MSQDTYALKLLLGLFMRFPGRAYDGDGGPGIPQSPRLLPDTPVKRHRKVFDDD